MERLKIMQEVVSGEDIVVVAPLQVALKKLIPKDVFVDNHISFKKGALAGSLAAVQADWWQLRLAWRGAFLRGDETILTWTLPLNASWR